MSPFRRYDHDRQIIAGCVDAVHTPHMEGDTSALAAWHFRPAAVLERKKWLALLRTL